MSQGERRLAAIMFTDMVGYTALTQSNEALAMEVLERHNRLLRPFFPKFHGKEVKAIGDSFLVEFDSALDALRCALEIQSFLHDYNLSSNEQWKINIRIGIHLGDVIHREGDVFGDAVNIASRIEPLAAPEGVVVSEEVYAQVHNKIEVPLSSIGKKDLKNVTKPVEVYGLQMPWEVEQPKKGPPTENKRVAVLPFVSMSPDPDDEYFADGLTEELIDRLCQVKELAVIARTSVMNYKGKEKNASQIGKELRADALVEGSIRKAGGKIRVTAQLVNAGTEEHMWSSRYDRDLEDIFAVQTDIAENVTGALKIRLLEDDKERIGRVPTRDAEAHELYLKGVSHLLLLTEDDIRTAIGCFEKAIGKDPNYVDPYRRLAAAYFHLAFHEIVPTKDAVPKTRDYVNKALQLDSTSAESHLSRALLQEVEMDYRGSRKEIERAIELNPNLAKAHSELGLSYLYARDFERANLELQRSLDLDPLSVESILIAATSYLYAREPEKALELYQKALSIDPGSHFVTANIGLCHIKQGMYEQGLAEIRKSLEMIAGQSGHPSPNAMADLPYALMKAGKADEARQVVREMVRYHEEHGTGTDSVARAYAAIGEADKALEWLQKAYEEHSLQLEWTAVDFNLEAMHSDPRFQAFLAKLGLGSSSQE